MNIIQYEKQEKTKKNQRCNTKKTKKHNNNRCTASKAGHNDPARDENNHPPKAQKDHRHEQLTENVCATGSYPMTGHQLKDNDFKRLLKISKLGSSFIMGFKLFHT